MGAEQSSQLNSPKTLRSQRDTDIAYASLSMNNPIDTSDLPALNIGSRSLSKPTPSSSSGSNVKPRHDIVVVSDAVDTSNNYDTESQRLSRVPIIEPIITISSSTSASPSTFHHGVSPLWHANNAKKRLHNLSSVLSSENILSACLRYQEHLKCSSDVVCNDQNSICQRIKEVDNSVIDIYARFSCKQRRIAKYVTQFSKIDDISTTLHRIQISVDNTLKLVNEINDLLPEDHKLEQFTLKN